MAKSIIKMSADVAVLVICVWRSRLCEFFQYVGKSVRGHSSWSATRSPPKAPCLAHSTETVGWLIWEVEAAGLKQSFAHTLSHSTPCSCG